MKKIKLFIIAIISFILLTPNAFAEVQTYTRTYENNYGVNKHFIIDNKNLNYVLSTPYVDASLKIYDFANILTEDEQNSLLKLINEFREKYNTEIIIYTVNKPYNYDKYNEDLAADFYDFNDFGLDFDYYNGIVLYRNAYSSDPYYDIYTFGEAQLYFNDYRYNELLDDAYNLISGKSYLAGFTKMINYINNYYKKGKPRDYQDAYIDDLGYIKYYYVYHAPLGIAFIVSLIVAIIVISIMIKKNKMVKEETKAEGYLDMSSVKYSKRDNIYIRSTTSSYIISSSSSGGGGHSGGGHSGGGHSSGGGRHG